MDDDLDADDGSVDDAMLLSHLNEAGVDETEVQEATAVDQTSKFIPDDHLRLLNISEVNYRVLQANCKERGLNAKSKKEVLVQLLHDYLDAGRG